MELDRGTLARVDRKLLARLGQDETFQMVRVPATKAKWSTWKRYCDTAGVSMGRAISALVDRELLTMCVDPAEGDADVLSRQQAQNAQEDPQARLSDRERDIEAAEKRLRSWSEHLRLREAELQLREHEAQLIGRRAAQSRPQVPKVGRNERCPCGSGLKHKHCHGLPQ